MNRIVIIGNLTADPQLRTTTTGKDVCSFTVAVNRRNRKDRENEHEADFFRVSAWGERGKLCKQYLSKGKKVSVVGSVSVNVYMKQDGTAAASLEVNAEDVEFLSPKDGGFIPVQDDDDPFAVR